MGQSQEIPTVASIRQSTITALFVGIFFGIHALFRADPSTALSTGTVASVIALGLVACQFALERGLFGRLTRIDNAAILTAGFGPPLLAMSEWWMVRNELPDWSPLFIGITIVINMLCVFFGRPSKTRSSLYILSIIGWYCLFRGTDTFVIMRPGTEWMHLGLFLGSWSASLAFVFLLPIAGGRKNGMRLCATLLLAALLLEFDARVLPELYVSIHTWWVIWAIASLYYGLYHIIAQRMLRGPSQQLLRNRLFVPLVLLGCVTALMTTWMTTQDEIKRATLPHYTLGHWLTAFISPAEVNPEKTDGSDSFTDDVQIRSDRPTYSPKPNIILLTVDALRWDILEQSEPHRFRHLERFAAQSLNYRHTYAQGSRTAIGMSSLMLGRYSAHIDWRLMVYRRGRLLDPKKPSADLSKVLAGPHAYTTIPDWSKAKTLAERLRDAGYYTAAAPYAGKNRFFAAGVGFDRGYDDFADLTQRRWRTPTSDNVMAVARAQMNVAMSKNQPWFQWIHLYDPHRWKKTYGDYERLVGFVDRELGKLVSWLERLDQLDNTVIALISDHGEAFGEHRHKRHGTSLFDEQARIPMFVFVPKKEGRTIHTPVAAIDLTASLLRLAGASTTGLDGQDLISDALIDEEPHFRPIFTELHRYISRKRKRTTDLKAIIDYPYKLIWDRKRKTYKLYNLDVDPGEEENLVKRKRSVFRQLRKRLKRFIGRAEKTHVLP
ncbi:MAG: sulfatase [Myxococcota bacterium]|nr:sulfatase [Myxococcota bacterium]